MTVESEVKAEEKVTVTEKVTDEALSSAFDAATGGKKEEDKNVETPAKEEAKETPIKKDEVDEEGLDQKTRSWLGRKLAGMKDQVRQEIEEEVEQRVLQKLKPREESKADEVPEIISTAEDVDRVIEARERKKLEGQQKYEKSYVKQARSFAKENPDIHEDVWKLMMGEPGKLSEFNMVRTGNPEVDAELNYLRAKAVVIASKSGKKEVKANVKSEKSEVSTSMNTDSRESSPPPQPIQLDADAKEFLRRIGKGDDWANEALKGDAPIHLAGRR